MTWLYENPLRIVLIGGLLTTIFAASWVRTGQARLLYAAIAVLVLTAAALVVERLVLTDREQVDITLHEIARLVEANDIEATLKYASTRLTAVRAQAAAELPQYRFREVSIKNNLTIKVFPKHIPPKAVAEFNVGVLLTSKDGLFSDFPVQRFVEVTLYQEEGHWRVGGYAHYDPLKGARDDSDRPAPPGQPRRPSR